MWFAVEVSAKSSEVSRGDGSVAVMASETTFVENLVVSTGHVHRINAFPAIVANIPRAKAISKSGSCT